MRVGTKRLIAGLRTIRRQRDYPGGQLKKYQGTGGVTKTGAEHLTYEHKFRKKGLGSKKYRTAVKKLGKSYK